MYDKSAALVRGRVYAPEKERGQAIASKLGLSWDLALLRGQLHCPTEPGGGHVCVCVCPCVSQTALLFCVSVVVHRTMSLRSGQFK